MKRQKIPYVKTKMASRSPFTVNDFGLEKSNKMIRISLLSGNSPGLRFSVHLSSISNPRKIVNNWFCSPLFLGLLKFRGHIGKLALGILQGFGHRG